MPTVAAVSQPAASQTVSENDARGMRSRWVLAASAAGLIAITIWNSVHKSLWIDEAYSFHSASRALAATWHQAIHFETQPPLYFILLNLWLRLGSPSVHWMRLLSTFAAIGCMAFLWATRAPDNTGRRGDPGARLCDGDRDTVVWAVRGSGGPTRPALFFSAWTMYFFVRLMDRQDKRSWLDATLYAIGAYAGLITFYYVGFVLAGHWIAAVLLQRGRRWLTVALTVVAFAFVPWLTVVHDQLTRNINPMPAIVPQLYDALPRGRPVDEPAGCVPGRCVWRLAGTDADLLRRHHHRRDDSLRRRAALPGARPRRARRERQHWSALTGCVRIEIRPGDLSVAGTRAVHRTGRSRRWPARPAVLEHRIGLSPALLACLDA